MSFWKKLENILRLNTNFGVITTKAHNVLHEVAQGIWFLCLKKTDALSGLQPESQRLRIFNPVIMRITNPQLLLGRDCKSRPAQVIEKKAPGNASREP